jgi:putative peptidoglycan lipid II flippase
MSLLKSSFKIGLFTLLSRFVGYFRDILIASRLGAGAMSDAFLVAFRLPNVFRSLFAEGAFNAAFVPLFAKMKQKEHAQRFAADVFNVLFFALIIMCTLAQIFMPGLVWLLASGFEGEKFVLATQLTRITFFYLLFISLTSLFGGILNSENKFGAVAFTPVLLNITMILTVLLLGNKFENQAYAFAFGVALAGVVQFLYLLNECRKIGFKFKIKLPKLSPDVKHMLKNMVPVMIGAGVLQINVLINTQIASYISDGSVSYLYYADRIAQLPLAIIGTAVGTALLPSLARLYREKDIKKANDMQNHAFDIVWFLSVPAAFGVLAIAYPIISVIFERNSFGHADSVAVSKALLAYSLGIPAFVLLKIFTTGFYSNDDTKTPVKIAAVCIAANIAISLTLIKVFGFDHVGLAIATSAASWLNVILLWYFLSKRKMFSFERKTIIRALKILLSSAIMALVVYEFFAYSNNFIKMSYSLFLSIIVGGMAFVVLAYITKAFDLREYLSILKRKNKK